LFSWYVAWWCFLLLWKSFDGGRTVTRAAATAGQQ
jgi:hypothetical protein